MKYVTFGEIMLRLKPFGYERYVQAKDFEASYAGAEANVAVSLACFGCDVSYVTKLPVHEIGQAAVNSIRCYGVDTSKIVRGGDRVGVYFLEKGASQRPSKVIYDRAGSAIATASASDFDWDDIIDGCGCFYVTGITPALSDELAEVCVKAAKTAKEKGAGVFCDVNYRSKLWSTEKAGRVLDSLLRYTDVCIVNVEHARDVLGMHVEPFADGVDRPFDEGVARDVARQLVEKYGFEYVALTMRKTLSADDNEVGAMLYDGKEFCMSPVYRVHIVDRVGGGDGFGAGLAYALCNGYSSNEAVRFAVAASTLKHSVEGDFNLVTTEEVKRLAQNSAGGRTER